MNKIHFCPYHIFKFSFNGIPTCLIILVCISLQGLLNEYCDQKNNVRRLQESLLVLENLYTYLDHPYKQNIHLSRSQKKEEHVFFTNVNTACCFLLDTTLKVHFLYLNLLFQLSIFLILHFTWISSVVFLLNKFWFVYLNHWSCPPKIMG